MDSIQFKRSHQSGKKPTSGGLQVGELAINTSDKKLFTKDENGNIIELGGGGISSYELVTTAQTLKATFAYLVDVSGGALTVTLPTAPNAGDWVVVGDFDGSCSVANTITILTTDSLIHDYPELVLHQPNNICTVTFVDAESGWKVTSFSGSIQPPTDKNGGAVIGSEVTMPASYNNSDSTLVAKTGGVYSRASYPELWAFVERNSEVAVTDAEWLAVVGDIALYSTGDGVTNFRVPKVSDGKYIYAGRAVPPFPVPPPDWLAQQQVLIDEINALKNNAAPHDPNLFAKSVRHAPVFKVVNTQELALNGQLIVAVGNKTLTFADNTPVTLPTLALGTDYAVYATQDGQLIASSNFDALDGYTTENSRQIGGFHYQQNFINAYSLYDLKFRPTAPNPKGMAIDISRSLFWADIYLLNTTPDLGTSRHGAYIATGETRTKMPALLSGGIDKFYDNLSHYTVSDIYSAYGKRLPTIQEFYTLALGVENVTIGQEPDSTIPSKTLHSSRGRSANGCEQVIGCLWQWCADSWDVSNGQTTNFYVHTPADNNGGGFVVSQNNKQPRAAQFGGAIGQLTERHSAGGKTLNYVSTPSFTHPNSKQHESARGVCDHHEEL